MLVLSRKLGEFLVLGDDIFISVFESGDDDVKIAIEAPKEVRIVRGEALEGREDIREKLDAIRARRIDSRTRRLRNEAERLGRTAAPTE